MGPSCRVFYGPWALGGWCLLRSADPNPGDRMDTLTSRRTVLRRALTGGAVVTIGSAIVPVAGLLRPAAAQTTEKKLTEPELAAFAAAVELAAAAAYDQAAGRLGPALQQAVAGFG